MDIVTAVVVILAITASNDRRPVLLLKKVALDAVYTRLLESADNIRIIILCYLFYTNIKEFVQDLLRRTCNSLRGRTHKL